MIFLFLDARKYRTRVSMKMRVLPIIVLSVLLPTVVRSQRSSIQSPCYGLDNETCLSNCFCGVCSKPINESSCTLWVYKEICEADRGAYTSYHNDERCKDTVSGKSIFVIVVIAISIAIVILVFICLFLIVQCYHSGFRQPRFNRL
jgi:hypothetical protein